MAIFYLISKYATVFGTLIKGLWEHITCGILKIFVEDARYLEPTEICGHVEHELPASRVKAFLMCFLPSVMNCVLAFFLGGAGYMGLFILDVPKTTVVFWVYLVLYYVGVSFFCNMFPSVEDALNNWSRIYHHTADAENVADNKKDKAVVKETNIVAKVLLFIPSAILYAGAYLEKYCVTFVISIVLTVVSAILA